MIHDILNNEWWINVGKNIATNAKKTQDAKFIEGKCRFVFMLIARSMVLTRW